MDLEIAEKSNVTWLQALDRQNERGNTIQLPSGQPYGLAATSSTIVMQRLPMLDWPVNLFDDAKSHH
jgi:hypothetical protein